jgi:hypothetical protein
MEAWISALKPGGKADSIARIVATVIFFLWNFFEGSLFHTPYSKQLVLLFKYPLWKILLIILVIVSALWCPTVAIMVVTAIYFYLSDLNILTEPWNSQVKSQSLK